MRWSSLFDVTADEGFEQEILRASESGLRIFGAVLLGLAALLLIGAEPVRAAALAALGLAGLGLCQWPAAYPFTAMIALTAAFAGGVILVLPPSSTAMIDSAPAIVLIVVLLVACVPVRPWQAFLLALSLTGAFGMARFSSDRTFRINMAFLIGLSALITILAAVFYRQRFLTYEAFLRTVQASSDVREMQTRLLVSEHAVSLGRLAAALSHELNTPIGALKNGVETLLRLGSRQAPTEPAERERIARIEADLRGGIRESADRLVSIVTRMQRFANLDRAEHQEADLNEILADVAALAEAEAESGQKKIALDLAQDLPPFWCRPARVSAALHTLLSNAAGSLERGGTVGVATRLLSEGYEIRIEDDGLRKGGRDSSELFDPGFATTGSRIRAANWDMANARQIVREHGGEIEVDYSRGKAALRVHFPLRTRAPG
jgi:signal transduction histidine kinase